MLLLGLICVPLRHLRLFYFRELFMSEPVDDPPLVTRPDTPAPSRPRPGFLEAVLWCAVFVAVQMFVSVVAVAVVFIAYMLAAPEPGKFVDEQLSGFTKSMDAKAEDERPPMPFEFGQALAWGMLAAQFSSLALIAIVLPRRIGPDWKRQIGIRRPHWLHVVLVLLLVPAFMIASDFIQTLFLTATGMKPSPALKTINGVFARFPWPLTVLAVALGPGVVEELWFRGFLGRGLCARYGILAGVLLTAVLFAVVHLDPSQVVVIAVMGLYLHFVYMATRCIWVPMLLHASNNGLAILLAFTMKEGDVAVPVIVHLVAFSLLVFGSVALWTSRAELEPVTRDDEAWWEEGDWKPESPGISAPPPEANVRLGYAAVSPAALMFALASFAMLMYLAYRYSR